MSVAHKAADAASVPSMANFRQVLDVHNKEQPGRFDPVTIADREAEQAIRQVVLDAFPEHGFFGEESERRIKTDQPMWIVDPIDGTRAYITGSPLWGTLIALYDGSDAVLGILEQPVLQERYVGQSFSNVSSCDLIKPSGSKRLHTRQGVSCSNAIMQTTAPEFFEERSAAQVFERVKSSVEMVRFGGDCYCYALLAMGFVDVVIEATLQPYDIAALIPIIKGAGGVITQWDGSSAVNGGSVIACGSQQLHEEVLTLIQSSG